MYRDFHGYTVYSDGRIINRSGKELKIQNNKGRKEIRLIVGSRRPTFLVSRLVYCLFNDLDIFTLDKDKCVTYKDGNKLNVDLSNLELVDRADLIQGEKHKFVSKLSDKEVEEIKSKYKSTRHKRPTNQHDKKTGYNSYGSLAEEYNVTKGLISMIIKGATRNENNYILES